jgi:hypothetical protein
MRHVVSFAFFLALSLPARAADPKVEEFAPHASGVALAEVVAVEKFDMRPADGPAGVRFKLKRVRGSGDFPGQITVITAYGGLRPPGSPEPKPGAPVKSDSLKKGERWWFAFSSRHEYETYNEGVIGFWPEKDAKAAALEAAANADAYRWHPQYDPQTKLAYGRLTEKDKWRVRVWRGDKDLWEKELPGTPVSGSFDWGLWDNTGGELEVSMPKSGKILIAETSTRLDKGNEFGLAPGPYWVNTGFDTETGKRLAAWVRLPQVSQVELVDRRYDPASGKVQFELRYDFLQTGGKAAGAKAEEWYRKIQRTFDSSGRVTKEEVFRYDAAAEAGKRWVKAGK